MATNDPALIVTRFPRKNDPHGTRLEVASFDALEKWMTRPIPYKGEDAHPLVSLASFEGDHRKLANVEHVYAIGLDVDTGEATEAAIREACHGLRAFAHTTRSSTPAARRWRVVVALTRPVVAGEHSALWPDLRARFAAVGIELDEAPKDPSRAWFVAATPDGGEFLSFSMAGAPLDVAAVPAEEHAPPVAPRLTDREARYRAAVLEKAVAEVAGAGAGDRNNALNRCSLRVIRLCGDSPDIRKRLEAAGLAAGLSQAEVRATVRSAAKGAAALGPAHVPPPSPAAAPAPPAAQPVATERDWRSELKYSETKKGDTKIESSIHNATVILGCDPAWAGVLGWDELAASVVKLAPPPWDRHDLAGDPLGEWTDADTTRVQRWFDRVWDVKLERTTAGQVVSLVAEGRKVNGVTAYLEGLVWDGTPRLDTWLADYLCADGPSEYLCDVGRWWLLSAVARAFRPGCKADHVLILEGSQGLGKSSALKVLAGEFFLDSPVDMTSKEGFLTIRGKWLIELAELSDLGRADERRAKAFFTSAVDDYRPPYASVSRPFPRRCVFAGTTNHVTEYLRDETGARRYWPVRVTGVALAELVRDRDQIWAEAVARYHEGEAWYPTTDAERARCSAEQEQRASRDEWSGGVEAFLKRNVDVSVGEILTHMGIPVERWDRTTQARIASILVTLGWEGYRSAEPGRPRRWRNALPGRVRDPLRSTDDPHVRASMDHDRTNHSA